MQLTGQNIRNKRLGRKRTNRREIIGINRHALLAQALFAFRLAQEQIRLIFGLTACEKRMLPKFQHSGHHILPRRLHSRVNHRHMTDMQPVEISQRDGCFLIRRNLAVT